MNTIPTGATHAFNGAYYRQASGGAYYWCRDGRNWRYMEDKQARRILLNAKKLEACA